MIWQGWVPLSPALRSLDSDFFSHDYLLHKLCSEHDLLSLCCYFTLGLLDSESPKVKTNNDLTSEFYFILFYFIFQNIWEKYETWFRAPESLCEVITFQTLFSSLMFLIRSNRKRNSSPSWWVVMINKEVRSYITLLWLNLTSKESLSSSFVV